jgi:hypothetical protein
MSIIDSANTGATLGIYNNARYKVTSRTFWFMARAKAIATATPKGTARTT